MGVVAFDSSTFKAQFPAFAAVGDEVLSGYFARSTLYVNNTDASRVQDVGTRAVLLNLLVAHMAQLDANRAALGAGGGAAVGRVTSASEGSVSVAFDTGPATGSNAWFLSTAYGYEF